MFLFANLSHPNNNPGRLQQTPVFFFLFCFVLFFSDKPFAPELTHNLAGITDDVMLFMHFTLEEVKTGEKRKKKKKNPNAFSELISSLPRKFLIFFFSIIIQYRSLSGDVIAAVTVTSSFSKKGAILDSIVNRKVTSLPLNHSLEAEIT